MTQSNYQIVPRGKLRTDSTFGDSYTILDMSGNVAGFALEWRFGVMAYDVDGNQLTNCANLQDAAQTIMNPPELADVDGFMVVR